MLRSIVRFWLRITRKTPSTPVKPSENNEHQVKLTTKEKMLIAAAKTGLLPLVTKEGESGYDYELFDRFWECYMNQPDFIDRES